MKKAALVFALFSFTLSAWAGTIITVKTSDGRIIRTTYTANINCADVTTAPGVTLVSCEHLVASTPTNNAAPRQLATANVSEKGVIDLKGVVANDGTLKSEDGKITFGKLKKLTNTQ